MVVGWTVGVVRTGALRTGVYFLVGGGGGLGAIVLGVVLTTGEGNGDGVIGGMSGIGDAASLRSDDTGAGGGMLLSVERMAHSTSPPARSTTAANTPASTVLEGPLGCTVETGACLGGGAPGLFHPPGAAPGQ